MLFKLKDTEDKGSRTCSDVKRWVVKALESARITTGEHLRGYRCTHSRVSSREDAVDTSFKLFLVNVTPWHWRSMREHCCPLLPQIWTSLPLSHTPQLWPTDCVHQHYTDDKWVTPVWWDRLHWRLNSVMTEKVRNNKRLSYWSIFYLI